MLFPAACPLLLPTVQQRGVEMFTRVGCEVIASGSCAAIWRLNGVTPDPWQSQLADARSDVFAACGRQVGKTEGLAVASLGAALSSPDTVVLLVGPHARHSQALLRRVRRFCHPLVTAMSTLVGPVARHRVRFTEREIELPNGSRIIALPGQNVAARSWTDVVLLVIDE